MPSWACILTQYCELLKQRCDTFSLSQAFAEVPVDEKVSFTYHLLRCDDFLPAFTDDHHKDVFKAAEFRNLGNQSFGRKRDTEALKYYTKSVTLSPPKSEALALAYANRSAVLIRLGRYSLSLLDINRALRNNYPDSLKSKLCSRREECLKAIERQSLARPMCSGVAHNKEYVSEDTENINLLTNKKKFELPEVHFKNDLILGASEKIKIEWSSDMGRCLFASQDIEPGEILAIENAYASVLLPKFYHSHCSNCHVRTEAPVPCDECATVVFCGNSCCEQASSSFHKTECSIISLLTELEMDKMEMLALRILIISSKQGKELENLYKHPAFKYPILVERESFSSEAYISKDYSSVHELEDNYSKRSVADLFRRSAAAAFLLHALKQSSFFCEANSKFSNVSENELTAVEAYSGTLLLKYILAVVSNAHEISELIEMENKTSEGASTESVEIGAALYPLLSLTNHSCDPNVVRHSYSNSVVFRSIQPIVEGQQLFDNYGYHFAIHCRSERQSHLKKQYYFDCCCDPCQFDWPTFNELSLKEFSYQSDRVDVKKVEACTKVYKTYLTDPPTSATDEKLEFLLGYLSLLHQSVRRPCKVYSGCQEIIKQIMAYLANHYTLDDIIL